MRCRAACLPIRTRALASLRSASGSAPGRGEAAAAAALGVADRLMSLFCGLCSKEATERMLGSHAALAQATCTLIDCYASWFATADSSPLQGALACLLRALSIAGACEAAAAAFRTLCLRCPSKLNDGGMLPALLPPMHAILAPGGAGGAHLSLADKQAVVEGMARVASGLRGQALLDAAGALVEPFVQRVREAVSGGSGKASTNGVSHGHVQRDGLVADLKLLASCVKYLAGAGGGGADGNANGSSLGGEVGGASPAVLIMEAAGDALGALAGGGGWQQDGEVMSAVVEVLGQAATSSRAAGIKVSRACRPWF